MNLKFYLNKFVKVQNVEDYTMKALFSLKDSYDKFLEETEGMDPDFPNLSMNGNKGKKIGGRNIHFED